jgi:copper transport protein
VEAERAKPSVTSLRRWACRPRALPTLLVACAAFGLSFWFGAPSASAHATLERTVPAADAHLRTEPRTVLLSFDESVDLTLGTAIAVGPNGARVDSGYTQSDGGRTVTIALRPEAGRGTYVVSYRVVSVDSHPVSGGFVFQVGHGAAAPASAGVPAKESAATSANPGDAFEQTDVRVVYAACRYAGFVGLLLLMGATVFRLVLWPSGLPDRRVRILIWFGYGLAFVASAGELVLQVPYATGGPLAHVPGTELSAVLGTTFGIAHVVRLAVLALAAPILVAMSPLVGAAEPNAPRHARWPVLCAVPLAIALLATWAYSGHAGSTDPLESVPSDVIHLGAMSVWLGGLVVLLAALLPTADDVGLRAALPRWSAIAMASVAALIASGAVQALIETGGWSALTATAYGQLLLAKIALLALVLLIANVSRLWVRRSCATGVQARSGSGRSGVSTARGPSDVRRLRRGVAAETVLAAAAVAVATVLIQTVPGRSLLAAQPAPVAKAHPPVTRAGAYLAAVRRGDVVIHVKVDPAVAGVQYIYLDATRPGGRRVRVRGWTLTVGNDALGLEYVHVPVLIDSGVGHHYVYGSFTMAAAGTWTIQVIARTTDVDETIATCRVRIKS